MPFQQAFFYIPAKEPEEAQEKMNKFLKTVVADKIQREFVFDGNNSYWCVAVEYLTEVKPKATKKSGKDKEWISRPCLDKNEIILLQKTAVPHMAWQNEQT